jgi:hypothetical protein
VPVDVVVPATGSAYNYLWSDAGTFAGALCFLLGAALMLPAWHAAIADRKGS